MGVGGGVTDYADPQVPVLLTRAQQTHSSLSTLKLRCPDFNMRNANSITVV